MVKCPDWGCTANPYSSHINDIYIEGVWQPLYAVDVHMDVSPPHYGRSYPPSFLNFARNLGYSQPISHGEMRWLGLYTQAIFISHQCHIYKRCLTNFICCGCAYGCVHTILRAAYVDKAFGILPQIWASHRWYVMVKWGDWSCRPNPYSSHIHIIYIKGVWQPLYAVDVHMDVSPPRTAAHADQAFGILSEIWATPRR